MAKYFKLSACYVNDEYFITLHDIDVPENILNAFPHNKKTKEKYSDFTHLNVDRGGIRFGFEKVDKWVYVDPKSVKLRCDVEVVERLLRENDMVMAKRNVDMQKRIADDRRRMAMEAIRIRRLNLLYNGSGNDGKVEVKKNEEEVSYGNEEIRKEVKVNEDDCDSNYVSDDENRLNEVREE